MHPSEPASRPLGLTLLAAANFVVGGVFGILSLMSVIQLANGAPVTSTLLTVLVAGLILACGAITSGLGYIRMSAFRGRTLGTVFGLLVLSYVGYGLLVSGRANAVYIVMAFIGLGNTSLVNTVYKDAFSED